MPFGDPKFTVVNPSPDVDQTLRSLRVSDWFSAAAISGGAWGYGYIFGKPIRMANASTGLALGMTCASMMLLQVSARSASKLIFCSSVPCHLTGLSTWTSSEWKVEASGLQGECQGSCQVRRMARPARIEASGRKEIPHGNWSHEPKCPAAIGLEELRLSSACYLPIGRFELFIVYHGRVTT